MNFFRRKPPARPQVAVARRVRELEVLTSRLIRQGFAGQYHAAFHGKGIEFSQVREYQPGDDIRTIDWNVTARTGAPHVKQFIEERDLAIILAVDTSASMFFGSIDRRKIDVASELVAVLAYSALKNGDRVGLALFDEQVRRFDPARRGRAHVQALVRHAVAASSGDTPGTGRHASMSALEKFVGRVVIKRSVIIVLSDFLDRGLTPLLKRMNQKHDVIALRILDPRETLFPNRGLVRLMDAESGKVLTVDLSARGLLDRGRTLLHGLHQDLRQSGIDMVDISTAASYDRELLKFFESRVARYR